jgi:hypothetical protein
MLQVLVIISLESFSIARKRHVAMQKEKYWKKWVSVQDMKIMGT